MPQPILMLDFDGVICDALRECALVTWLGLRPPERTAAVSSYLPAMPREFLRRFQQVRDYARVLDHFVVAHRARAAAIGSRADFEALFGTLHAGFVARFTAAASAARGRCRQEEPEFWLDLHTIYPGVADLLRRHAGGVAVVTAKDEASVRTILDRHGLGATVAEVVGECADKAAAIRALCRQHRMDTSEVLFVDDNLVNVRRVAAVGARTRWATWGYHTPEDLAEAARHGVTGLQLAQVPALAATRTSRASPHRDHRRATTARLTT